VIQYFDSTLRIKTTSECIAAMIIWKEKYDENPRPKITLIL